MNMEIKLNQISSVEVEINEKEVVQLLLQGRVEINENDKQLNYFFSLEVENNEYGEEVELVLQCRGRN